jgi:hypothetical protein
LHHTSRDRRGSKPLQVTEFIPGKAKAQRSPMIFKFLIDPIRQSGGMLGAHGNRELANVAGAHARFWLIPLFRLLSDFDYLATGEPGKFVAAGGKEFDNLALSAVRRSLRSSHWGGCPLRYPFHAAFSRWRQNYNFVCFGSPSRKRRNRRIC